jgi:hypothetical protein
MKKILFLLLTFGMFLDFARTDTFAQDTLTNSKGKYLLKDAFFSADSSFIFSPNVSKMLPPVVLPPQKLVSCDNGDSRFSLLKVVADDKNISFQFDAANLSAGTWQIGGITGEFFPTSNVVIFPEPSLNGGTYTLVIKGTSCEGSASKKFVIEGTPPKPPPIFRVANVDVFSSFKNANGKFSTANINWSVDSKISRYFLGAVDWRSAETAPSSGIPGYDYNPLIFETTELPWKFGKWVQQNVYTDVKRAVGPDYVVDTTTRLFEFDIKFPKFSLPSGKFVIADFETERSSDAMLERGVTFAKNTTDVKNRVFFLSDEWVHRIGCPRPYVTPTSEFQKWITETPAATILESFKYSIRPYSSYAYIMLNWEAVMFGVPDSERYKLTNCLRWYSEQNYNAKLGAWMQSGLSTSRSTLNGTFNHADYAGISSFLGTESEFRNRYKKFGGQPDYAKYLDVNLIGGYQNFPTDDAIIHHYLLELQANKRYYPKKLTLASIWHDIEIMEGWQLSPTTPTGSNYVFYNKPAVFNQTMYNWGVWTVAVGDGYNCWSDPVQWTTSISDYPYAAVSFSGQKLPPVAGKMYARNNLKNIDWLQRGVWQVSKHKDIIEAKTEWVYPMAVEDSYRDKKPLIAYKLSSDGSEALVLALDMFSGEGVNNHTISLPNAGEETKIITAGTFTTVQRIQL